MNQQINEQERIHTIGNWLKRRFGGKTVKLSLDGGFTCPNRDGTKGIGGCLFCSPDGSGELASDIPGQLRLLSTKWPHAKYFLAYFQSHTSTYAPVSQLRRLYDAALQTPLEQGKIVGLAIATRPDCLDPAILDLLSEYQKKTFLWIELGLQTTHGDRLNRCYDLSVYDHAVRELNHRNIPVVTHLILGLPGETRQQMEESVRYVCQDSIFGLKLHMFNLVKGSAMAGLYPDYVPFSNPEEYIQLVCDILEYIPPEVTMHRLTGDVPRNILLSPKWSYKKRTILNGIAREMKRRNSHQGCKVSSGLILPSL